MTLLEVEKSTFERCLGQSFTLRSPATAPAEAELIAVESLGRLGAANGTTHSGKATRESFSLLLRAPKGWRGGQRIYTVGHPTVGELDIFLVPVAQDAKGLQLEAVFNFTP